MKEGMPDLSRRKFLVGAGAGVAAGILGVGNISAAEAQQENPEMKEDSELKMPKELKDALRQGDPLAMEVAKKIFLGFSITVKVQQENLRYMLDRKKELKEEKSLNNARAIRLLDIGIEFIKPKIDSYNYALSELAELRPDLLNELEPKKKLKPQAPQNVRGRKMVA